MDNPHKRKKEPETVRRALLDSAASIAASQGFAAVTMQTVAAAANVTKGGLIHHFPNKQALVEAMALDQLDQLDASIDGYIAADPENHGRFTRAYVMASLDPKNFGSASAWGAIAASVGADPAMRTVWEKWLADRLEQHRDTDSGMALQVVRLAADGGWFAYLMGGTPAPALRDFLLGLTKENQPVP